MQSLTEANRFKMRNELVNVTKLNKRISLLKDGFDTNISCNRCWNGSLHYIAKHYQLLCSLQRKQCLSTKCWKVDRQMLPVGSL
jgi:hypothetical protein